MGQLRERVEWEPVTAYVVDCSYFSGKMEGYLRYKEIPYQRRLVDMTVALREVLPNTGLMKVPVVQLANGQWLKDTTPMIDWFEAHCPEPEVVPKDPALRFLSKLVEDYADEWCWRAAMYWRWRFPKTRKLMGRRLAEELLAPSPAPAWFNAWYFARRQIAHFLKGDGVTPETEDQVRTQYFDLLDSMSRILDEHPYLLGSHPSLVDFGLFGPMFRHYALDPEPRSVMVERAPAVWEWVARLWNARASRMPAERHYLDFSHPGWQYFLKEIVENYWPFLRRNALAWREEKKRFDHDAHGVIYRNLPVVHYRVYCLEVLQREYAALENEARTTVDAALAPFGSLELLSDLDSGLTHEFELPLHRRRRAPSLVQRAQLYFTGTPWDLPKWDPQDDEGRSD